MSTAKGQILSGKVSGITKFGAFISLENGDTGLVHISEVADTYVKDVNEFLKMGDEVKVKPSVLMRKGKSVFLFVRPRKSPNRLLILKTR